MYAHHVWIPRIPVHACIDTHLSDVVLEKEEAFIIRNVDFRTQAPPDRYWYRVYESHTTTSTPSFWISHVKIKFCLRQHLEEFLQILILQKSVYALEMKLLSGTWTAAVATALLATNAGAAEVTNDGAGTHVGANTNTTLPHLIFVLTDGVLLCVPYPD